MAYQDSRFFLSVNHHSKKDPKKPWYTNQVMGHNRIGSIMKRMATHAGLDGKFTNHSVRRTACSQLVRAGIPLTVIAQLTGHKNIGSLLGYTTASKGQQREMANILMNQGKRPAPKSSATNKKRKISNEQEEYDDNPQQENTPPPAVAHIPIPQRQPPNPPPEARVANPLCQPAQPQNPAARQPFEAVNINATTPMIQDNNDAMSYVRHLLQGANIGNIGTLNINFYNK